MSELNIEALLTGDVNRLRYITRHSTSLTLHKENVAEHSYYVALYSMFICDWVNNRYQNCTLESTTVRLVMTGEVLRRCLLHDLDESRTGDFQRPFKYRNKELKSMLDKASKVELGTIVQSLASKEDVAYTNFLENEWEHAKDDSYEGAIVEFADYLSVVSYLYAETKNANNTIMQDYKTMENYSTIFHGERFDFIRALVDQTMILVEQVIQKSGFRN